MSFIGTYATTITFDFYNLKYFIIKLKKCVAVLPESELNIILSLSVCGFLYRFLFQTFNKESLFVLNIIDSQFFVNRLRIFCLK